MVFTLHRYIFRELFKVFVLAVVALTVILSLGSILRPVQEYGVGPRQVVYLMSYFLPITLTFVLPMAALFAGALVYGRLASDNELDACKASGISVLTLLYPGLFLAIFVSIGNLILSFYVMPAFIHRAERALKADAKQILFRNIQRKGYYKLPPEGQYLIYADQVNTQNDTLSGVVVTQVKASGIKKIITAERAAVKFGTSKRFDEVQEVRVAAQNTYQVGSEDEAGISFEQGTFIAEFGSLLGDEIAFKKIDEMKRIRADLIERRLPRFYPIIKLCRETYAQFTAELLAQDIASKISEDANSFYKLHSGDKLVEFRAQQCAAKDEREVELTGEVIIVEFDAASKRRLCTLHAPKGYLGIEGDEFAPTLTMDIYNAEVQETGYVRMRHIIRGLVPPESVSGKFRTGNILEDIEPQVLSTALQEGPSPRLMALQSKLQKEIRQTLAEIGAELHSRLVFGIGCISMILIGIGLGIIRKGGHLLSAFGVSCVPAAALIVCIMSGKQLTKNLGAQSISGIALMWLALGGLTLLALGIYRRLMRN